MKEKICNIFTNKIFIVVLLFIATLFSFTSNCFATSIDYEGSSYTLSSDISSFPYILITKPVFSNTYGCNFIYVVVSTNEIILNGSTELVSYGGDSYYCRFGDYSSLEACSLSSFTTSHQLTGSPFTDVNNWLYSSEDIIEYSSHEVVFQGAPVQEQQQGETQGIQALTLEQAEQIPQAMTQTLRVVIPVGLAIFGIGLVIFLMRYLILRLM